ncbi:MAG TPA: helix-turn-helix domain-containing protein [Methylomirabilota bacterium]|nr:helix-turn-helix domain-containing protein [Methylomirabilota bacterium]
MARSRPPGRLDQIISAGLRVFMDKGYRRTQMADVAQEMGVSPGTLYTYVEGKEALFHLLIDRALLERAATAPLALPVATPPAGATLARLKERLTADARLPGLQSALARRRAADPRAELEAVVQELYALIEKTRLGITLIERSALDLPELARVFYAEVRRGLLDRLRRYLEARIRTEQFRPVPDAAAAARLILEAVAWFAMHRHRDPDPGAAIDDRSARETVVHFIVSTLVPTQTRGQRAVKETAR